MKKKLRSEVIKPGRRSIGLILRKDSRELSVQIDDMQPSMLDVHERARSIGQNIARETANTREETYPQNMLKGMVRESLVNSIFPSIFEIPIS